MDREPKRARLARALSLLADLHVSSANLVDFESRVLTHVRLCGLPAAIRCERMVRDECTRAHRDFELLTDFGDDFESKTTAFAGVRPASCRAPGRLAPHDHVTADHDRAAQEQVVAAAPTAPGSGGLREARPGHALLQDALQVRALLLQARGPAPGTPARGRPVLQLGGLGGTLWPPSDPT